MRRYDNLDAKVLDWHDGDTAHVDVSGPFGWFLAAYDVLGHPQWSCRLQGVNDAGTIQAINAPELSTTAGKIALGYVQQLCPAGTVVTATYTQEDKYGGRWDGTLTVPGVGDLGRAMVAAGQAVWASFSTKPTDTQARVIDLLERQYGVRGQVNELGRVTLDGHAA